MASEPEAPRLQPAGGFSAAAETATAGSAQQSVRRRLPLARKGRRLSFDLRLRLWLTILALPTIACAGFLAYAAWSSWVLAAGLMLVAAVIYAFAAAALFGQITRPLQTLANVVAALREDDFSFRARGGRRGDSLGDLALEINSLAGTLQTQRGSARDALTLAERVMNAMRTPVLAFAADGTLRLLNPAAASAFGLHSGKTTGRSVASLGLEPLFHLPDGAIHTHPAVSGVAGETRWSVRRSRFRLGGVPHELVVLADVDAALREEERIAWQRLIRVLSHEINNSLTPITSLAGSLRTRLPGLPASAEETQPGTSMLGATQLGDLRRGLHLIEDRALSLHRFLQAYQQLARLPRPNLQPVVLSELVQRVVALEGRLPIRLLPGPDVVLSLDPAQIEQLLINVLRNAVEAALSHEMPDEAAVVMGSWSAQSAELVLRVEDNGPGITDTANLFVPFYTTKPGGSGIGLVLAQGIAQAHRGGLTLANRQEGAGCRAELRLPLSGGAFQTGGERRSDVPLL